MDKQQKRKNMFKSFGKSLVDLGKLVFGGIVISAIIKGDMNRLTLIAAGFIITALLIILGTWLSTDDKEEK
jgi:undecaprenyl pyrophosphate phosphatase UppP